MTEITLRFYIGDNHDEEFFSIESPCQPFSIGDKVWVDIINNMPEKWDIPKRRRSYFLIEKIETQILKSYGNSIIEHLDVFFTGKISEE